jgi:leucyl/phenylalanyl-tRNA--protein transferase
MPIWWSPDPRAILELDELHVSRRLARTIRAGGFHTTRDVGFSAVLEGCATAQDREGRTWITADILRGYGRLHELGVAHSVEVWREGQLAGGIYGLALGAMFSAESMFYRVRDASKVALAHLVAHLQKRGYTLLDIQQLTPHTRRLGAREIPRGEFLARLGPAVTQDITFEGRLEAGSRRTRG